MVSIVNTSSLAGFPLNFSFLARLKVMNESVLPPSQRTLVVNCFPLDFPAVSHCVGNNVPPPVLLDGLSFCKCKSLLCLWLQLSTVQVNFLGQLAVI